MYTGSHEQLPVTSYTLTRILLRRFVWSVDYGVHVVQKIISVAEHADTTYKIITNSATAIR